jgi:hypothetical protein
MPATAKSRCRTAITCTSRERPIAAKIGAACPEVTVGLALCATTQIEHAADSVRLRCRWADSAAAVHNIRDRQSQADHRTHTRIV